MQPLRVEAVVDDAGNLTLRDLQPGQRLQVTLVPCEAPSDKETMPFRGLPVIYRDPFEPVGEDDWSANG